ncbi:MAG: PEGA domain-containing protein [Planctomycetes bacterium]|nr:PEGA domain-containing protein [Planctomycetota bacterium]
MTSAVPSPVPIASRRLRARFASGAAVGVRRVGFLAALLVCGVLLTGCVHRRMTIRSDPPGAQVLVDGEPIGYTPASTDFTYYGTREITLIKPGYETLTVMQPVRTPWYQIPPLDFLTDNLLPFRVTNRHDFTYTLQPKRLVPTSELLGRANALRSEAQMGP